MVADSKIMIFLLPKEGLTSLETPWHQPKPWLGVSLY
jgi:hypothetical protein